MYVLISESKDSKFQGRFEVNDLEDLYEKIPIYEEVEDFHLSKLYDTLDYDILVLKPVKDDFLILYANSALWGFYGHDFPKYMKGRLFGQLLPKFKHLKTLNKFHYSYENGTRNDIIFKLYQDNQLLFAGNQFCVRQDNLLYVFAKNETQFYLNKEKEETIFEESKLLLVNINEKHEIVKANQSFLNITNYSIAELNKIGLNNLIIKMDSDFNEINNFTEALDSIFNQELNDFAANIKVMIENKGFKWFSIHLQLKSDGLIQVICNDISDLKKAELNSNILSLYLDDIQKESKTVLDIYDNEGYHWNDEIFNILEIDLEDRISLDKNNILINYIVPEDKERVINHLNKLSLENPNLVMEFKVKTHQGKIKYLKSNIKTHNYNGELIYIGITQDITNEVLAKKSVVKLRENLNSIQSTSNIAIGSYKNGEYSFTPEIYNILEINPEDYPENIDIIEYFVLPEDKDKFHNRIQHLTPQNPKTHEITPIKTPNGEIKILEEFIESEFNNNGKLIEFKSFIHDITEETLAKEEILRLEENFRLIQSTAKMCIVDYNHGKYSFTPEIFNILDIEPTDYGNIPDLIQNSLIIPEDKGLFNDIRDLTPEEPESTVVYRIYDRENKVKYLLSLKKAIFNENDELIRVVGYLQDITDETLIKEEALKLRENFNLIQGSSKIFIAEYDNGKYSFTSEVYNILGVNPEDYPETVNVVEENVLPEDKWLWEKTFQLTPENPEFHTTYRVKCFDNSIKYLFNQNMGLFNDEGELVRVIGFLQDVTEEILVKQEALRLEENFSLIQGSSKVVICEYENGKYSFTSEIYNLLGIDANDYPDDVDIVEKFVIPEDKLKWSNAMINLSPKNSELQTNYRIQGHNNVLHYIYCQNKAIFNENGELTRIVGFLQDLTDETIANNKALRLEESINIIGEFSKIVIAYYENGKYTWTPEIYNILKINPEDYGDDVELISEFATPEDTEVYLKGKQSLTPENNTYSQIIRIFDNEGELKYLNVKLVVSFNDEGNVILMYKFIQDVTDETVAKKEAIELKESLEIIQKTSKIVIGTYNEGKFSWTSEIYNILEINPGDYPSDINLIKLFSIPGDKDEFEEKISTISPENQQIHKISTIKTPNGNVKVLEEFIEAKFDDNSEMYQFVTFIHEITDTVNYERELEQLSEDRKILLQEVHHRVKNNLQLILSFLNLESRFNKNNPEYVIEQTRNRIRTMALTHEEVYQSPSVSKINIEHFLTTGMTNLFNLYSSNKIKLHFDIEPIELDIDKSIPLGLMVNELALNTIKYAFPETGQGDFNITLKIEEANVNIKIWDNGVGLPEDTDLFNSNSLGFIIIRSLTKQLEAELNQLNDVSGFGIQLIFEV